MNKSDELRYKNLLVRYRRQRRRDAFIKKNKRLILSLSMKGWPRTKEMKDYPKWLRLVMEAKIKRIYGLGTANCDVIAQLDRFAKQLK